MPISSSAYARRPLLPRPISTTVTSYPPRPRKPVPGSVPPAAVVGRLGHHLNVVRMALDQPCPGDLREPGLLEIGDRPRPAVAHRGPQTAHELIRDRGQRAAERYLRLDALGHQFVLAQHVVLEVAVLGVG